MNASSARIAVLFTLVVVAGIATPSLGGMMFIAIYRHLGMIIDPRILMIGISITASLVLWALFKFSGFVPQVSIGVAAAAVAVGILTAFIVYYAVLAYWVSASGSHGS